ELQQRFPPGAAHRTEVVHAPADAPRHQAGEGPVREPGVDRPRAGLRRVTRAQNEIRLAADDRRGDERQIARVERAVAVHEAHDVARSSAQAGETRSAEPWYGLDHDPCTEVRR